MHDREIVGEPSKDAVVSGVSGEKPVKGLLYNAFPMVFCHFPYKRINDTQYEREAKVYDPEARIKGTMRMVLSTADKKVGLAHGSLDRALLVWLQTKAVQQKSKTVRWASKTEFFKDMGLTKTGADYKRFSVSFRRLVNTVVKVEYSEKRGEVGEASTLLRRWAVPSEQDCKEEDRPGEQPLFEYAVTLSDELWYWLQEHPIPYRLDVMRHFTDWPMAWDLMMFIHYRLWLNRNSRKTVEINWEDLHKQLGSVRKDDRRLRTEVRKVLAKLRDEKIWPELNAEMARGGKLILEQPTNGVFLTYKMPKADEIVEGLTAPPASQKFKKTKERKSFGVQTIKSEGPILVVDWRGDYADYLEVLNEVDFCYQNLLDNNETEARAIERAMLVGDGLLSDIERLNGDEHEIQMFLIGLRARQARRGGDQVFDIVRKLQEGA